MGSYFLMDCIIFCAVALKLSDQEVWRALYDVSSIKGILLVISTTVTIESLLEMINNKLVYNI